MIEEFTAQLEAKGVSDGSVRVAGSSHIGGHKYAGKNAASVRCGTVRTYRTRGPRSTPLGPKSTGVDP